MNDGEIWLKSLNDRGQFLLTRRKRYNESTDWWILRFKSWLIGSKRILQCLLRSVACRKSLDRVGNVGFGGKARKQFSGSCKFVGDTKQGQKGRTPDQVKDDINNDYGLESVICSCKQARAMRMSRVSNVR